MIAGHGLMASVPDKAMNWEEHVVSENVRIPFLDLSGHAPDDMEELLAGVLTGLFSKPPADFSLPYRIVLMKTGSDRGLLALFYDHIINDRFSDEILVERFENFRTTGRPSARARSYASYVEHLHKGPLETDPEALVKALQLDLFRKSLDGYKKALGEKAKGKAQRFEFSLDIRAALERFGEDMMSNLAFALALRFCGGVLGLDTLPFRHIYHGRQYRTEAFFDIVGEFIDVIPVPASVNAGDPLEAMEHVRQAIGYATAKNVNLTSLLSHEGFREEWGGIGDYLSPEDLSVGEDSFLGFNFQIRDAIQEDHVLLRRFMAEKGGDVNRGIFIESAQVKDELHFYGAQTLGLASDEIRDLFHSILAEDVLIK